MRVLVRGAAVVSALVASVISPSHSTYKSATPSTPQTITVIRYSEVPTSTVPSTTTTLPVIHHPIVIRPRVAPHIAPRAVVGGYAPGTPLWNTWTWDKTAYEPSASDPTRTLPFAVQRVFACIRYAESRNHPNDTNQSSGAEGLYQFLPYIWQYGAHALGIAIDNANYATPEQQSAVAVWYYERNGGFSPEWSDGCTPS